MGAVALLGQPEEDLQQIWWERETVRIDLATRVEIGKVRVQRLEAILANQRKEEERLAGLRKRADQLALKRSILESEVAKLTGDLAEARESTLLTLKQDARGTEMARLEVPGGRVFERVYVKDVTDAGVEIRHQYGSTRLTYHELSPEQRVQFGLDAHRSAAALFKERQNEREYELELQQQETGTPRPASVRKPAPRQTPAAAERTPAPAAKPRSAGEKQSSTERPRLSSETASIRNRSEYRPQRFIYFVTPRSSRSCGSTGSGQFTGTRRNVYSMAGGNHATSAAPRQAPVTASPKPLVYSIR